MKKMKIATIRMSVEPHMLRQVICLPTEHILDLIETVGAASVLNTPLAADPDNKIIAAFVMLTYANTMLEQCGCKIDTKIDNQMWTQPSIYITEVGNMENMS